MNADYSTEIKIFNFLKTCWKGSSNFEPNSFKEFNKLFFSLNMVILELNLIYLNIFV